ncbi:hypothetical protein SPURM210S_08123 [Streptomyces purpurascens]
MLATRSTRSSRSQLSSPSTVAVWPVAFGAVIDRPPLSFLCRAAPLWAASPAAFSSRPRCQPRWSEAMRLRTSSASRSTGSASSSASGSVPRFSCGARLACRTRRGSGVVPEPVSWRVGPPVLSGAGAERWSGASGPLDAISARRVRLGRAGGSDRSPTALPGVAGDSVWSASARPRRWPGERSRPPAPCRQWRRCVGLLLASPGAGRGVLGAAPDRKRGLRPGPARGTAARGLLAPPTRGERGCGPHSARPVALVNSSSVFPRRERCSVTGRPCELTSLGVWRGAERPERRPRRRCRSGPVRRGRRSAAADRGGRLSRPGRG